MMNCKEFYLHSDDLDVTLVIPQNELFSERFAADVVVGQVVPVSYTHLDVYKRQP